MTNGYKHYTTRKIAKSALFLYLAAFRGITLSELCTRAGVTSMELDNLVSGVGPNSDPKVVSKVITGLNFTSDMFYMYLDMMCAYLKSNDIPLDPSIAEVPTRIKLGPKDLQQYYRYVL